MLIIALPKRQHKKAHSANAIKGSQQRLSTGIRCRFVQLVTVLFVYYARVGGNRACRCLFLSFSSRIGSCIALWCRLVSSLHDKPCAWLLLSLAPLPLMVGYEYIFRLEIPNDDGISFLPCGSSFYMVVTEI